MRLRLHSSGALLKLYGVARRPFTPPHRYRLLRSRRKNVIIQFYMQILRLITPPFRPSEAILCRERTWGLFKFMDSIECFSPVSCAQDMKRHCRKICVSFGCKMRPPSFAGYETYTSRGFSYSAHNILIVLRLPL